MAKALQNPASLATDPSGACKRGEPSGKGHGPDDLCAHLENLYSDQPQPKCTVIFPGKMIHNLHFLRGVAALMVVAHHGLYVLYRNDLIDHHPGLGVLGVDLFFVISGFVIVISTKPTTTPIDFLRRRFLRVVPLYWLVTLCVFGLFIVDSLAGESSNLPTLAELIKSLLFIPYEPVIERSMPVLLVGWTLYFEVFFYLIFFIGLSVLTVDKVVFGVGLAIAAFAALGLVIPSTLVSLNFYSNPVILEFVWGMILAVIWKQHRAWLSKLHPLMVYAMVGFGLAFLVLSNGAHNPFVAGIGAALLIGAALGFEVRGQVVKSNLSNFFGNISYALYLIHFTYFFIAEAILTNMGLIDNFAATLTGLVAAFIGACFLAWMSFRLVETPLAQLARPSPR
ncbi:MAG: acyltransferase [Pseudomonadota bacterium]